jgi:hypothetical protein
MGLMTLSASVKRIVTRHHMTEEAARKRYGPDAEEVEWTRVEVPDVDNTGDLSRGT